MQAACTLILTILALTLTPAVAQLRSFDEYENRPEKFLNEEVTVGVQSAERISTPYWADGALKGHNIFFRVYTIGRATTAFCDVLVPKEEADSFYKRYNTETTLRHYKTRPLRGVFLKFGEAYYLGFKGASLALTESKQPE
jgi:hypothetical protein